MKHPTDMLHEAKRLRLLAAALELHHTRTEANVVPIPGGDRVIAIGTPAEVRALLAADVDAAVPVDAAAICDGVAAKSKNSLFRSGAKICAGEIRAAQSCSVEGCTAPAGPNTVGACAAHMAEFKTWSVAQASADQVDSEGGHHD